MRIERKLKLECLCNQITPATALTECVMVVIHLSEMDKIYSQEGMCVD